MNTNIMIEPACFKILCVYNSVSSCAVNVSQKAAIVIPKLSITTIITTSGT